MRVNTTVSGKQQHPALAVAADGSCVIVWDGQSPAGNGLDIFARCFAADRTPLGEEYLVNTHTTDNQQRPSIAMANDGCFVVTWESVNQDGDMLGIFAQRFTPGGTRDGEEFQVNTHTKMHQSTPSAAMNGDGRFVIVWQSIYQVHNWDIFCRLYNWDTLQPGGELLVNTNSRFNQSNAAITMFDDGHFIITWQAEKGDNALYDIAAQRFDMAGEKQGSELRVNTHTYDSPPYGKSAPQIASNGSDRYVIVWEDYHDRRTPQDGDDRGVYGQVFSIEGKKIGDEFRANETTAGPQRNPSVAMFRDGTFMVVWSGNGPDNPQGVFLRQFGSTGRALADEQCVDDKAEGARGTAIGIDEVEPAFVVIAWDGKGPEDDSGVFAAWMRKL